MGKWEINPPRDAWSRMLRDTELEYEREVWLRHVREMDERIEASRRAIADWEMSPETKAAVEPEKHLTALQMAVAEMLADGLTPDVIYERTGVAAGTLDDWRRDPIFAHYAEVQEFGKQIVVVRSDENQGD